MWYNASSCIGHCKQLHCARIATKVEAAIAYRLLKIAAWVSASRSPARRSCCCLACSRGSQPAAGEVKFHAGEAANAFKMTHLRMAHSSRDRSTRYQDDFQDCWVQLIMVAATPSKDNDCGRRSAWMPICRQGILWSYFRSADRQV